MSAFAATRTRPPSRAKTGLASTTRVHVVCKRDGGWGSTDYRVLFMGRGWLRQAALRFLARLLQSDPGAAVFVDELDAGRLARH